MQSYKYDSLYRLVEAGETNNNQQTWKQNFGYDRFGNRTGHDKFIGTTQVGMDSQTHPTIDPATNRFSDGQNYLYDKNGNLTRDAAFRSFTFNGENKQTEVKDANGISIGQYFYDGEGRRVKKFLFNSNETTVFVYDGMGKLIAEYSTKPPPPNPTTSYTMTDHLGSPRVITNSLGQVVSRRDFMPFGEELSVGVGGRTGNDGQKYSSNQDDIRQKFTGYQKDKETQLDFAEARMYENRHARFTAVDPLLASGKSGNPQTFNRYVYVMNNPLFYIDPTGLQAATHVGKVYTDGKAYHHSPFEGSHQYKGESHYVEASDGFTYTVSKGGYYSIGKTAEINARAESRSMADSRKREELMNGTLLPTTYIPEFSIDSPGTENILEGRYGLRNTISPDSTETNINNFYATQDEAKIMSLAGASQYATLGGFREPRAIPKSSFNFSTSNLFTLRDGYGVFGKKGLQLGSYKIDALYENPTIGGGTIFSMKQTNTGNLSILQSRPQGNLFRLDYGIIHKTGDTKLHTTIRFTFRGEQFGSTAQRRLFPSTTKPPFFEPF